MFLVINFALIITFISSPCYFTLCFHFACFNTFFFFISLLISFLTIQLFRSVLLIACIVNFLFFFYYLFLIAYHFGQKRWWISIFSNLLKFVLWPILWFILKSIVCTLERHLCLDSGGGSALDKSARFIWTKSMVYVPHFCNDVPSGLSIYESEILKFPTITVLSISSFWSVSIFLYLYASMLSLYPI